jgi:hypothetical protein
MPVARPYWWLIAHDQETGEDTLIFGSEKGESDARSHGLTMLPGINFEVKMFRTRDLSAASAIYRGKKLETGHSLHDAKRRLVHEKGLRRKKIRQEKKRRSNNDIPFTY